MVIASTGVRPAEVKRTLPGDVDMERRAWIVRTTKGGEPRALWLNDDMKAAWEAFIAADAAGWPKDVRPYQARHSMALELGERGVDIGDIQGVLGHRQVATTRKHYAPVLVSRLKQASQTMAGRFGGWQAIADTLASAHPVSDEVH
jgi:site-specific recombinase XerD